jgi:hypothetical protein
MSSSILRWAALVTLSNMVLCGCSYFQGAANDDDVDLTDVSEMEEEDVGEADEPGEFTRIAASRESSRNDTPAKESGLKIGDRFPFTKSVEQRVTQVDSEGTHTSSSRTDVSLLLVVDSVTPDGRKLISVQFPSVRYEQDIFGTRVEYSSDQTNQAVPPEALLYAGLANNGFSFWIGPNNKVMDVVGYPDFLRRCLRGVPEQHRSTIQQQLESVKSGDSVAKFIDESIGLLTLSSDPRRPGSAIKKGEFWELEPQQASLPIPVVTNTRCILKELSSDTAEILMTGRVNSSRTPVTIGNGDDELSIAVKGGLCTGSCYINPRTGLPTQSQIQRSLELVIETSDGQKIQQTKETVSSISLNQETFASPSVRRDSGISQTGFQSGNERVRRGRP